MRIGVFPGSFNPVHIGHLVLANYLTEYERYDAVWFVITPYNPLKNKKELMDQNLRLRCLQKAVQEYSKFEVCNVEWTMSSPFYTIDTLQKLRANYHQHDFELIIGADNAIDFYHWKDHQIILDLFKILVYPRKGCECIGLNHPNLYFCKDAPKIDISSTFVRRSIKMGKEVRFYLPKGIYEEILRALDTERKIINN